MDLSADQQERYSRHLLLDDIGEEGQKCLLSSRVLVVGAGGIGSSVLLHLAAAGVGTLGIIDGDRVSRSNLQRQIIYSTSDIGRFKVESARDRLVAMNPDCTVRTHLDFLTADNAEAIIDDYDFVVDGSDNFTTKFLINDACVLGDTPFSHGGVLRFEGQTMTVLPGKSCCYRCIFRTPPPQGTVQTCSRAGVLGPAAGLLGTIQAAEAIKFLTGAGHLLTNTLLVCDVRDMRFRTVSLERQDDCPVCGFRRPTITELAASL